MPITRKQISAAASTSNPPARQPTKPASNLPVSDDDLFEQSAIQVSSASRTTRTVNHQIPKEMRKQLHGAFKAAANANSENAFFDENRVNYSNTNSSNKLQTAPQQRTLVKRSTILGSKYTNPVAKILLAPKKEEIVIVDNEGDDDDDAIFEVPVTSPPRDVIAAAGVSSAGRNCVNTYNTPSTAYIQSYQQMSTPSKLAPVTKQLLTTPSKLLNQLVSHQIMAEVRRTPLTMAEKKRRLSIVVGKGAALDKSTKTAISVLKPEMKETVSEIKEIVCETKDKECEIIDILGSSPKATVVEEVEVTIHGDEQVQDSKKKKRKQFIRNQATESAPPDILSTLDKVSAIHNAENADVSNVDIIIENQVVKVHLHDISCIAVPPPPKLEDLETLDPELYVKLKCGNLKDDLSVPFISETDRLDIENFLESFTSPELTRNFLPVAIIGEGTFSTVYKVIDKNFYECDNSGWMEYSRQSPLDWLRLWRWVYEQEPKERLVLVKDGKRVVDRSGRCITSTISATGTVVASTQITATTVTTASTVTTVTSNTKKDRLPGLLRRYLLEWAVRSLDSLQCGQEASESLLKSITPKVLQAAMLRFRPFFTALKRINATSSPQRILDEISFLKHLGGKNNVVPLINGIRCEDQVLVTFPYFYSEDFREFLGMASFNINSIACYMRSLFISLAHLHAHGIIHRDIKPSNFLFAPENGGRAVLLDFGLAQKSISNNSANKNSSSNARNITLTQQQRLNTSRNNEKERKKLQAVNMILNTLNPNNTNEGDACAKLTQLTGQLGPGYFNNDPRAGMKASRAGTRGFRAPEVLFKCPNQTTALDIWSAGVILLTLLTRRYPFFQSSDDFDAIVEIANIFGNEDMATAAKLYSRRWLCNVPSVPEKHVTWPELCSKLNPGFVDEIPEECYDLLRECLNLNSERRITAKAALKHPFISKYAK